MSAIVVIAVSSIITLTIGVLTGVLLFYCISKHWCKTSKPESSSHQAAGRVYAEVCTTSGKEIVLRENMAYVQTIELKANEAYGHVQH